jgi:uncharacterized membrane protein YqgA involved in biofilm formation
MSDLPNAPAEPALDFDRAEVSGEATGMSCKACKAPIVNTYYSIGGQSVCTACHARFIASQQASGSFGAALLNGTGAAIVGAAIYYAIVAVTHYELGLVAIVVGVLVGKAVRKGAGSRTSSAYRGLALALTYMAICVTYIPEVLKSDRIQSVVAATLFSFALPPLMLFHFDNLMGLIIMGIGLYEAYKLSAPAVLAIQGPFALASAAPAMASTEHAEVAAP